jgi:dolichyl-diphosphooligosaccharide--protein glycosyltransferase
MEQGQELKDNLKSTWGFCKSNYVIFLLLILVAFNIFIRIQPYYLPMTDDWAKSTFDSYLTNQVQQQAAVQYPNLPQANLDTVIAQEKAKYYQDNKAAIDQQIASISNGFKDNMRRDNGMTYLLELDPYMWYRYAKNIEDNGYVGDKIAEETTVSYGTALEKGSAVDTFSLAPSGKSSGKINFHPWFIYLWSLIFKPFGIDMMGAEFFIPIFWVSLAIFPIFFIVRKIAGDMGGFMAAFIMITNVPFLSRAIGGFSDTDCYQAVFPLFITWFIIEAYNSDKDWKRISFSIASGVTAALFSFTWIGWAFVYDIMIGFFVCYSIILFATKASIKDHLKIAGSFFAASLPLIVLFRGWVAIPNLILGPLAFSKMQEVAVTKIWPNVLTTVAEQNSMAWSTALSTVGSKVFIIFALIGIIYLIKNKKWLYLTLFPLWFMITFYAISKGTRYAQLNMPAFAILAGIGVGYAFLSLVDLTHKHMDLKRHWSIMIWVLLSLFLIVPQISPAYAMAKSEVPMMNDAWWNGLQKIDAEAPANSIINSWWDMGHWFKAVGNRPSTFDGASQDTPPAHWIGRTLLTSDEREAKAILRMLVCGGNSAYDEVLEETEDPLKAVNIIKESLTYDKDGAREYLKTQVSENTANIVVDDKMFCYNPPTDYFITSEDMIGKSGVWGHFGAWNFEKAKMYQDYINGKDNSYFENYYNLTPKEADDLLFDLSAVTNANDWVAPWPSYASSFGPCQEDENVILCQNNIQQQPVTFSFDKKTKDIKVMNANTEVKPAFVEIVIDGKYNHIAYNANNTIPISLSILPDGRNIMAVPEVGNSMFNRLLNFNGVGLDSFEPFYQATSFTNERIYIWRLKW